MGSELGIEKRLARCDHSVDKGRRDVPLRTGDGLVFDSGEDPRRTI